MPTFHVTIVNETFSSSNSYEMHSIDDATGQALRAALEIGSDEVAGGKNIFAAEVRVAIADEVVRRFVVSISAAPLQVAG